jgi:hypothetical protein
MPLMIREIIGRTIYKIIPVTPNKPDSKNIMEPNNQPRVYRKPHEDIEKIRAIFPTTGIKPNRIAIS